MAYALHNHQNVTNTESGVDYVQLTKQLTDEDW
jgi:hypothetical protein